MAPTLPILVTDLVRRDFLEMYEIDGAAIGAGSTGQVFLAAPREAAPAKTGQILGKIAVKVLLHQDKKTPEGEELPLKLKREVEMMSLAQGHPNVAKFMGLFVADHPVRSGKSWFLAMEYYSGADLAHRVAKSCLSDRSSQYLVKAMLGALGHLHGLGIVHRDVKADNILLTSTGVPVLADFGISCMADDKFEMQKRCGSPGYMAPEMFTSQCGKEVDLFALGVVLYFAVSGSLPFKGPTLPAMIRRTVSALVDFTDSPKFEQVSSCCKAMILGLTEKNVKDRLTVSEALDHEWFTGVPATARSVTPVPKKPVAPSKPSVLARFTSGARKVVPGSVQLMFKQLATAAKEAEG